MVQCSPRRIAIDKERILFVGTHVFFNDLRHLHVGVLAIVLLASGCDRPQLTYKEPNAKLATAGELNELFANALAEFERDGKSLSKCFDSQELALPYVEKIIVDTNVEIWSNKIQAGEVAVVAVVDLAVSPENVERLSFEIPLGTFVPYDDRVMQNKEANWQLFDTRPRVTPVEFRE